MEIKKSPKADLERGKTLSVLMGFVVGLAVLFVGFEWSTRDVMVVQESDGVADIIAEEEVEITRPENTPPPPPPPPAPVVTEVLNVVEDDVELEQQDILSSEDNQQEAQTAVYTPPAVEEEEEEEEDYIEPAAIVVNHIANRQIQQKRQRREQAKVDEPVDKGRIGAEQDAHLLNRVYHPVRGGMVCRRK